MKILYKIIFYPLLICIMIRQYNTQEFLDPSLVNVDNWTSCDEFLANHTFNAKRVVEIDWQIFYFWSYVLEESLHFKFSFPSKELINRFKVELDAELKPPVNWNDAELFMETSIDFSGLFIKENVSGLYRVIPSLAFSYSGIPTQMFALKVVEPGYLGILNCKYKIIYGLAPVDKMPHYDSLNEEAKKLGFWGEFNRSHLYTPPLPAGLPEELNAEMDEDDEDMEIYNNPDTLQFL